MIPDRPAKVPGLRRFTVDSKILIRGWAPGFRPTPISAALQYDTADPLAVRLVLYASDGDTIEWYLARQMLADGLSRKTGLGNVEIRPDTAPGWKLVHVTIRSPAGDLFYAHLSARDVLAFVKRTEAIVPIGTEYQYLDLDLDDLVRRLTDTD